MHLITKFGLAHVLNSLATVGMEFDKIPTNIRTRKVALQKMTQHRMEHHPTIRPCRTAHLAAVTKVVSR